MEIDWVLSPQRGPHDLLNLELFIIGTFYFHLSVMYVIPCKIDVNLNYYHYLMTLFEPKPGFVIIIYNMMYMGKSNYIYLKNTRYSSYNVY